MSEPNGKIKRLARTWNALGEHDPLWAVLSEPSKRGRRWYVSDFFASGEGEIAGMERTLADLHVVLDRKVALDFGCGAGRVTRALASRFDQVFGIDVAESMIAEARRLNADLSNATFEVNARTDLKLVESGSVDFFYSRLVFQHMDPELTLGYVAELGRILSGRGTAVFQIPIARAARSAASRVARNLLRPLMNFALFGPRMSMFAVSPHLVYKALAGAGLEVLTTLDDAGARPLPSKLYIAVRRHAPAAMVS